MLDHGHKNPCAPGWQCKNSAKPLHMYIRCGEVCYAPSHHAGISESKRSRSSVQSFTHHINCSLDYIIQKLSIVGTWRPFRCGKMPLINSCMILFIAKIKHFPFRSNGFSLFILFFLWIGPIRFGWFRSSLFFPICMRKAYISNRFAIHVYNLCAKSTGTFSKQLDWCCCIENHGAWGREKGLSIRIPNTHTHTNNNIPVLSLSLHRPFSFCKREF